MRIRQRPSAVRNAGFVVCLTAEYGSRTTFARDKKGWAQSAPPGIRRRRTAEQVLNHLLSALVLGPSVVTAKVKLKRGGHINRRLERVRGRNQTAERPTVRRTLPNMTRAFERSRR
jgi:hypothetical protein